MRQLKHRRNFLTLLPISLWLTLFLSACGPTDTQTDSTDPGDNTPTINRELSGTAATGAPVAGTITVVDANGVTSTTQSDATGAYSLNLEGRPGPYLIRVEPNDTSLPIMYSYATGSGVANITPFTTLALYLAYQADLANAFTNWATMYANWRRADLEKAVSTINANFNTDLLNAGVEPTTYDFFTTPFVADHTGIDAFLDNYSVSVNFTNNTYEITDSSGQAVTFDANTDTTGYYIGALFPPPDGALWKFTSKTVYDGTETTQEFFVASDIIPWNEERFKETFWDNVALQSKQVINCDGNPSVSCDITVEVTGVGSDYQITGNGEVGTLITASANYSISVTGYIATGVTYQNIDESHSWSYTWSWERTQ